MRPLTGQAPAMFETGHAAQLPDLAAAAPIAARAAPHPAYQQPSADQRSLARAPG